MNQKSLPTGIIGAVLLFVVAAFRLISIFSNGFSGKHLIYYLGVVAIGVGVLIGQYIISMAGAAVCALFELYWVMQELRDGNLFVWTWYELTFLIAFVLLIVLMLPYITSSFKADDLRKLWFLPGAIVTIGYLPSFFYCVANFDNYISDSFKYIFTSVIFIAGFFFVGHAICNQPAVNAFATAGATPGVPPTAPTAPVAPTPGASPITQATPATTAATTVNVEPMSPAAPIAPAPGAQTVDIDPAGSAAFASAAELVAPTVDEAPGVVEISVAPEATVTTVETPVAAATPAAPVAPAITAESMGMLRKYKELLDAGILTQEEFDERKKKILG